MTTTTSTRASRKSKPERFLIYQITNKVTGKSYVGQTKRSLTERWADHKRYARLGRGFYLHSSIRLHGEDNFIIATLVSDIDSKEQADILEEFWIRKLDTVSTGYNMNYGAKDYSTMGKNSWQNMEPEKKQIRKTNNGEKTRAWWRSLSDEQKTDLKEVRKARSKEARSDPAVKIAASKAHVEQWTNRTTQEREALSIKFSERKRKWYQVVDPDGNNYLVFGLKNFCRERSLHQGAMNALARGKGKTYKGWKCHYA